MAEVAEVDLAAPLAKVALRLDLMVEDCPQADLEGLEAVVVAEDAVTQAATLLEILLVRKV